MTIPAALMPWVELRYFLTDGTPNANGKLYFYETDGVTPKDTYSDYDLTDPVPNTNPVILAPDGRPTDPIYIGAGGYTLIVTDADDVELYSITFNGGSGSPGSAANPLNIMVPLTDDDIKELPSGDVTTIAAQGSGTRIIFQYGEVLIDATAGAYANVDATDAWGVFRIGGVDVSAYVANDPGVPATGMTSLFTTAAKAMHIFGLLQQSDANWWSLGYPVADYSVMENAPLLFHVDNNSAGPFTGGDPANSGVIRAIVILV